MATKKDKRLLGSAKICYVIATQNALEIAKLYPDKTNETRIEMEKAAKQNIVLAENLTAKIASDPAQFDTQYDYLSQFDAVEKVIIEKSRIVRNRCFNIWSPEQGITK